MRARRQDGGPTLAELIIQKSEFVKNHRLFRNQPLRREPSQIPWYQWFQLIFGLILD